MLQSLKNIYHFFNASLAAVFYRFPAKKLTVIGVTGTDGKTTTATLIYHLVKTSGRKVALISTVAAYIGNQEVDTGFHVTSPDPWALQKLIRRITDANYKFLVLEATSHGLDQHRLLGSNISIGVLTNITHEHLDYHKTYTNYLKTKAKLFNRAHHAIINRDDQSFARVKSLIPSSAKIHAYSLETGDKSVIKNIKLCFDEAYNCENALAAYYVAKLVGLEKSRIIKAMKSFPGVLGRMDKIPNSRGITTIVDFAHTPNALKRALISLRSTIKNPPAGEAGPRSKIIAVYGSAGLRDTRKRVQMGQIGSQLADVVVLTAEDPRTEDVNHIIAQMKHGTAGKAKIMVEPDRQTAINLAINQLAKKGDTVAVFGKGHEKSLAFGKIEYPWSDHEAIKKALKKPSQSQA